MAIFPAIFATTYDAKAVKPQWFLLVGTFIIAKKSDLITALGDTVCIGRWVVLDCVRHFSLGWQRFL